MASWALSTTQMTDSVVRADEERKRLGQFFSGDPLSLLLAHLASTSAIHSAIDPMVGLGDMLEAVRNSGSQSCQLTGIEIDPEAAKACRDRLTAFDSELVEVLVADAFNPSTWTTYRDVAWDLVITNPPYVRYQRTARPATSRVRQPDATETRSGLKSILEERTALPIEERLAFSALADQYSGLSDLAVPSWILCASLVAPGGRLAMVVPDTWLSRDFATPILYLLERFFELEIVVEDGQARWFADADVRTNLVIARRVLDTGSGIHKDGTGHLKVRLECGSASPASLVGALYPTSTQPEKRFAESIRNLHRNQSSDNGEHWTAEWEMQSDFQTLLLSSKKLDGMLDKCEPGARKPTTRNRNARTNPPGQVIRAIGFIPNGLKTLEDLGWRVGQGLRTGGNRFFYCECVESGHGTDLVQVDRLLGSALIQVPSGLLRSVLRKQADLDNHVSQTKSSGRVFWLSDHALPEDAEAARVLLGREVYLSIPEPVAEHIRNSATIDVGNAGSPRRIPELSAVRTNVRTHDPSRPEKPPRFWYQLPQLMSRHTPDLLVPRVNHLHPQALANPNHMIVDANFSTLWPTTAESLGYHTLIAVLNSSWSTATLECLGTALAGGALKLEATHLRRLSLPPVAGEQAEKLGVLGQQLIAAGPGCSEPVIRQIDIEIAECLGGTRHGEEISNRLRDLAQQKLSHRSSK